MLLRHLPGLCTRLGEPQEHHRRKACRQGRHRFARSSVAGANFGPPFHPLEYILRDAVVPYGQYHGGVGRTRYNFLNYPFLTGRSTRGSQLVGELMIQVLAKDVRRYGW
jgi:hypothetical protein